MTESLGDWLRQAREAKTCSLEDVERATRIRLKHLAALEAGDYASFASEAQARGFLRNYALFLELEVDQALLLYEAARRKSSVGQSLTRPAPTKESPPEESPIEEPEASMEATPTRLKPPLPPRPAPIQNVGRAPQVRSRRLRWLSLDSLFAGVVTLALVTLVVWGVSQVGAGLAAQTATPTRAFALGVGGPTSAATAAPTTPPLESTPTLELPTPLAVYSGVNLSLRAEQRIWVRVVVDGVESFVGQLAPGEAKEFVGQTVIEVVTGNGQGTRVIWNGRDQGTLGELGQVVVRLWTLEGMIIPTPTITPTPSKTPPVTSTPIP